jgi:hypothetical protein
MLQGTAMIDERLVIAAVNGAVSVLLPRDETAASAVRVARLVGRFLATEEAGDRVSQVHCLVEFDGPWEKERNHVPWHVN